MVNGKVNTACLNPNFPEAVTWRMLINHRSSTTREIPDVDEGISSSYVSGQLYSSIRDLATFADLMLSYGIGSLWTNKTAMEHVFGCQERNEYGKLVPDNSPACS
jgi:hypothetical protein